MAKSKVQSKRTGLATICANNGGGDESTNMREPSTYLIPGRTFWKLVAGWCRDGSTRRGDMSSVLLLQCLARKDHVLHFQNKHKSKSRAFPMEQCCGVKPVRKLSCEVAGASLDLFRETPTTASPRGSSTCSLSHKANQLTL